MRRDIMKVKRMRRKEEEEEEEEERDATRCALFILSAGQTLIRNHQSKMLC
jgi:hypothetical protein